MCRWNIISEGRVKRWILMLDTILASNSGLRWTWFARFKDNYWQRAFYGFSSAPQKYNSCIRRHPWIEVLTSGWGKLNVIDASHGKHCMHCNLQSILGLPRSWEMSTVRKRDIWHLLIETRTCPHVKWSALKYCLWQMRCSATFDLGECTHWACTPDHPRGWVQFTMCKWYLNLIGPRL